MKEITYNNKQKNKGYFHNIFIKFKTLKPSIHRER